jgi:hypothetical protein
MIVLELWRIFLTNIVLFVTPIFFTWELMQILMHIYRS